ncbi:MAG: hypothetical protein PHQ58_02400 [Rhodoferax sp.]|uniref:hypothetical protein n=1 Tax=Rhodoferax sp. TaxID=50421 RepID=UPI0026327153|nr:hypothetical protein [Rhodoferax sp.]MDD2879262.1 hypothetical protein [Rhodoferax sp.]
MYQANQIMGVPASVLTQMSTKPGASPELKFMAALAANSTRIHADRVRIVQNERLRQTKLSASIADHAPEADTVRRLRVAQLNATSL